jgi:hypothetical protein
METEERTVGAALRGRPWIFIRTQEIKGLGFRGRD